MCENAVKILACRFLIWNFPFKFYWVSMWGAEQSVAVVKFHSTNLRMESKSVKADFVHSLKSRAVVWLLITFISAFGAFTISLVSVSWESKSKWSHVESKTIDSSPTVIPEAEQPRETRSDNRQPREVSSNNGTPAKEPLRTDSSSSGPVVLPSISPTNSSVEAFNNATMSQSRTSKQWFLHLLTS